MHRFIRTNFLNLHWNQLGPAFILSHNYIFTHTHPYLHMYVKQKIKCQCRKNSLIPDENELQSLLYGERKSFYPFIAKWVKPKFVEENFVPLNKTKSVLLLRKDLPVLSHSKEKPACSFCSLCSFFSYPPSLYILQIGLLVFLCYLIVSKLFHSAFSF